MTGVTTNGAWWRVVCPDGTAGNCFVIADPNLTQPASVPGGEPGQSTPERIEFAPGAISATVYGFTSAIQPKRYVLHAQSGQTMQVTLNVDNINAYLTVLTPTGENMAAGPVHQWSGVLPVSGDYVIEVLNPGTRLANFDLMVMIQ